jgi:hypothetical protein
MSVVKNLLLFGRSGMACCVTSKDLDCFLPFAFAFDWRAAKQQLEKPRVLNSLKGRPLTMRRISWL